jgi:hypothetical protein
VATKKLRPLAAAAPESDLVWLAFDGENARYAPLFFAESHASTSQECQQKAAECLRLMQTLLNSTNKAILLEMVEAWISHAEQQKAKANNTPKAAAD